MRQRIWAISIVFFVASVTIWIRLFYWQILRHDDLMSEASAQHLLVTQVSAKRGVILARDKTTLASTEPLWKMFLYRPEYKGDTDTLVSKLPPLLSGDTAAQASDSAKIKEALKSGALWVPLIQKVDKEQKSKIEALGIKGLGFEEYEARTYPESSMSAHVLGFVGKNEASEDFGYFGLEGYYDLLLSGKEGSKEEERDALGLTLVSEKNTAINSYQGTSLVTTIDKKIQYAVEERLNKGLALYGAETGSVVVMDARDGGILAMASTPSFDPGKYFEGNDSLFKNPVISDTFEPGSIMKPIVMASAFDANVLTPDSICAICNGPYSIDKYVIRTWDNKYHANSTMADIIKNSDNVGMVYAASKLGTDKLIDYFEKFGFGSNTGIDLQGEVAAKLRPRKEWGEVERATASFGQGIAVTPIQMLKAVSAIANKGVPMNPHLVTGMIIGNWETKKSLEKLQRAVSEKAALDMTQIMVDAVKKGEAKWAVPKGYEFAGKTGTAQIAIGGGYDEKKTNASFIGFAPARDPKFIMLVVLSQPKTSQWASETAAPLWFKIALDILRLEGIGPS